MCNTARMLTLLRNIARFPGRLLIHGINQARRNNGAPPLTALGRGASHAFVWFALFVLFSAATPAPSTPAPAAASATGGTVVWTPEPKTSSSTQPTREAVAAPVAEQVVVSRVIDGDTLELADGRRIRVLGIDSCESRGPEASPGGKWATAYAEQILGNPYNQPITITSEPGVDLDRYDRHLRYVQMNGYDFGTEMVKWDHTGVYQGDNDANDAYITQLYAADREYAAAPPPAGRDCARGDWAGAGDYGGTVDLPEYSPGDGDDDDGEGRFCRRRWWC